MIISTSTTISNLGLVLIFGMRHGLEPDHLAAIDGLTLRTHAAQPRWTPWVGAFFALGHGVVVVLLTYAAGLLPGFAEPSERIFAWLEWIPITLLFVLGLLNARALILARKAGYRPIGLRSRLLPGRIGKASGPVAAFLIGVLFGSVLDTALQAAAWGYAATLIGGTMAALLTGLTFSAGMLATDSLDGWVTARVLLSGRGEAISSFRRRLGWPVVLMCFCMSGYGLAGKLDPAIQISEAWFSAFGAAMLAVMALIYGYTLRDVWRQA